MRKCNLTELERTALIFEPVKPYFKYAEELKTVAPVVSYACSIHGIDKGIKLFKMHKPHLSTKLQQTVQDVFMNKLGEVEKIKASEAGQSEDFSRKDEVVKEFLSAVFVRCVASERKIFTELDLMCEVRASLRKTKQEMFSTVKPAFLKLSTDFYRCSHFIQLLADSDGNLPDKWREKQLYCKFKAVCGFQMIAEGQIPPLGNPFVTEENDCPQLGSKTSIEAIMAEFELQMRSRAQHYEAYGSRNKQNSSQPTSQKTNYPTMSPIPHELPPGVQR